VNRAVSKPSIRTASRWPLPSATHRGPTLHCPTSLVGAPVRRCPYTNSSTDSRLSCPTSSVKNESSCPTLAECLVREHDANTTGANGRLRERTRRKRDSGEMTICLHQRERMRIGADVTLSAHNPKVAGSNPAPATNRRLANQPDAVRETRKPPQYEAAFVRHGLDTALSAITGLEQTTGGPAADATTPAEQAGRRQQHDDQDE
jgi:hypothetical protein